MKKAALLISVLILIFTGSANAQTLENAWFDGYLKLMDDSIVKGDANYNIRSQVVQVKVEDKVQTYSENQIKEMRLTSDESHHHFMLVALKNKQGYVERNLVEIIYRSDQHFSLVKRHQAEILVSRPAPSTLTEAAVVSAFEPTRMLPPDENRDSFISAPRGLTRRGFDRIIINYDGAWTSIRRRPRRNLLAVMEDKQKGMKRFIKSTSLNLFNDQDVIKVLREYERLKAIE